MSRVLIVEDSPVAQVMIHGLLRRRWPELAIEVCGDVPSAIDAIGKIRPDLVLADLQLPGASGLELIEHIRDQALQIPSILITGAGSEQVAMQAILAGATGYVPKAEISRYLLDAVDRILRLSRRNAAARRLMGSCFHQDLRFSIDNDLDLVMPFVEYVRDHLGAATPFSSSEVTHICIALHESLTNAINHGNLELNSDLRQEDERIYYNLGEKRRRELPYMDRRVYIALTMSGEHVDIRIRDEGPGFDAAAALARVAEIDFERIGGRGLLLIKSFMDTLTFNESGNEIRFSKRAATTAQAVTTESALAVS